jgi:hypothetical protein
MKPISSLVAWLMSTGFSFPLAGAALAGAGFAAGAAGLGRDGSSPMAAVLRRSVKVAR